MEEIEEREDDYMMMDMFDMYSSASSELGDGKIPTFSTNPNSGFVKWTCKFPKHLWDLYKCKQVTIGVYETSTTPMARIRKAITGNTTTGRVGTRDEDYFFVVNWATGLKGRQTPLRLFFDCPSDFEKHCFVQVSDEIKAAWQLKMQKYCNHMKKQNRNYKNYYNN